MSYPGALRSLLADDRSGAAIVAALVAAQAAAGPSGVVEELVVTAQKKEEALAEPSERVCRGLPYAGVVYLIDSAEKRDWTVCDNKSCPTREDVRSSGLARRGATDVPGHSTLGPRSHRPSAAVNRRRFA